MIQQREKNVLTEHVTVTFLLRQQFSRHERFSHPTVFYSDLSHVLELTWGDCPDTSALLFAHRQEHMYCGLRHSFNINCCAEQNQ